MQRNSRPLGKSVIEQGVVCSENDDDMKPPLREEVTAMVVNNIPSLTHHLLQFIYHLTRT